MIIPSRCTALAFQLVLSHYNYDDKKHIRLEKKSMQLIRTSVLYST